MSEVYPHLSEAKCGSDWCEQGDEASPQVLRVFQGKYVGIHKLGHRVDVMQEYTSIGLLGAVTTTMDSEGAILTTAPFDHITREDVEKVLDRFRGEIMQVPPMSAHLSFPTGFADGLASDSPR